MSPYRASDENPGHRSVRKTAIDILSYLHQHPSAKDTPEGIARWWVNQNVETVEKALTLLIEEGAVEKDRGMYCLRSDTPPDHTVSETHISNSRLARRLADN